MTESDRMTLRQLMYELQCVHDLELRFRRGLLHRQPPPPPLTLDAAARWPSIHPPAALVQWAAEFDEEMTK